MALRQETVRVSGVRCERCIGRLAAALDGHDGLELARADLLGRVTLAWDEGLTSREAIMETLARAGFREVPWE